MNLLFFSSHQPIINKECIFTLLSLLLKRCSGKKLFLKISQNSQDNTGAWVSFLIKLQASGCFCLIPSMFLFSINCLSLWLLNLTTIGLGPSFLWFIYSVCLYPAGIYMLKFNNRNIRTRCEICSNLTIKTPERRQWRHSGVFVVNFEHISHFVLVFLLLTLNI